MKRTWPKWGTATKEETPADRACATIEASSTYILYEKTLNLKLSGNNVYYTITSKDNAV